MGWYTHHFYQPHRLLHELEAHPQHGSLWRVCTVSPSGGVPSLPSDKGVTVLLVTPEQLQSGQLSPLPRCKAMRCGTALSMKHVDKGLWALQGMLAG